MRPRSLVPVVVLATLFAGTAQAQTQPAAPVAPGSTGVVTSQSGSTGSPGAVTGTPTGQPADTRSNDSSAAGNANQPSHAAPQGGGGGK